MNERRSEKNEQCRRYCSDDVFCCRRGDLGKGPDCCDVRTTQGKKKNIEPLLDYWALYPEERLPCNRAIAALKYNNLKECEQVAKEGGYSENWTNWLKIAITLQSYECMDILCEYSYLQKPSAKVIMDSYGGTFTGSLMNNFFRNWCYGCAKRTLIQILITYKLDKLDYKTITHDFVCSCSMHNCLCHESIFMDALRSDVFKEWQELIAKFGNFEGACIPFQTEFPCTWLRKKIRESTTFVTPIFIAVFFRREDILKILLDRKYDPNLGGLDDMFPLHEAVGKLFSSGVQLLLDHKANINQEWRSKKPIEIFFDWCPLLSNENEMKEAVRILVSFLKYNPPIQFRRGIKEENETNWYEKLFKENSGLALYNLLYISGIPGVKKIRCKDFLNDMSLCALSREKIREIVIERKIGKSMFEMKNLLVLPETCARYLVHDIDITRYKI